MGSEVFSYFGYYVCLATLVSLLSLLPPGFTLCSMVVACSTRRLTMMQRQQIQQADRSRHKWGCAYTMNIGQPLVVTASGNHSLLEGVPALVPWLSPPLCIWLHFYLRITQPCHCSWIPFLSVTDKTEIWTLYIILHNHLPRFPLGNNIVNVCFYAWTISEPHFPR